MTTATVETRGETRKTKSGSSTVWRLARLNWLGGGAAWVWFVIVMLPIY